MSSLSSLRLRLLVAWAIFIAATLQIAGVGLRLLFERSIMHRTEVELAADLRQLRRGLDVTANGDLNMLRAPTDPQFDMPFGGRYWQISEANSILLRSQSLKDETLALPRGFIPREASQTAWLVGPKKRRLYAVVQEHALAKGDRQKPRTLTLTTAVNAAEIEEDTNKFANELFTSLATLAGLLLLGAWMHVTVGLRPLEALRTKVASVRGGHAHIIEGAYPDEIMPLVLETNALLTEQRTALDAARQRAGDLAHGLNTPLAVMSAKSRVLRRKGEIEIADEIDRQVGAMHRHVERELARARARGAIRSRQVEVDATKLTRDIVSAIRSLPREAPLAWELTVPDTLKVHVDADDLNNILGNLLENAHKWAKTRVEILLRRVSGGLSIAVSDDGPGVPDKEIDRVLLRGERGDFSVGGSGLGLAIVSDLVELYKGTVELSRGKLGGLTASVFLPD